MSSSRALRGRAELLLRLSQATPSPAEAVRLAALAAENLDRARGAGAGADAHPYAADEGTAAPPAEATVRWLRQADHERAKDKAVQQRDAIAAMILANDIMPDYERQPLQAVQTVLGVQLRQALDHVVHESLPPELTSRLQQLDSARGDAR
jgi:hypothetical protein